MPREQLSKETHTAKRNVKPIMCHSFHHTTHISGGATDHCLQVKIETQRGDLPEAKEALGYSEV